MATIGRRAAVAELARRHPPPGTPAWLAWLGLHLVYLIGFRNRLSVLPQLGVELPDVGPGPRLILGSGEAEPEGEADGGTAAASPPEA